MKQRRNFAITRSRSFAHPVTGPQTSEQRELHSCIRTRRPLVRKKSLVFKSPEIESFENIRDALRADHQTSFDSLDHVLQVKTVSFFISFNNLKPVVLTTRSSL